MYNILFFWTVSYVFGCLLLEQDIENLLRMHSWRSRRNKVWGQVFLRGTKKRKSWANTPNDKQQKRRRKIDSFLEIRWKMVHKQRRIMIFILMNIYIKSNLECFPSVPFFRKNGCFEKNKLILFNCDFFSSFFSFIRIHKNNNLWIIFYTCYS